jgi:hypothetical protein
MKASAIRNRLYDYIRVADDKKLKAIYTMLEGEIGDELSWWEDKNLLKSFDDDYKNWKSGKTKGYSVNEVVASIDSLRAKRLKK